MDWETDGLKNVTAGGKRWPEGFDVLDTIRGIVAPLSAGSVLDYGCGYGRLCEAFSTEEYHGYDTNPQAIYEAERRHPAYSFGDQPVVSDLVLFYTVLLHIEDVSFVESLDCDYVLIAEIMDSSRANGGKCWPPTYNRDWYEFENFDTRGSVVRPYKHYKDTDITFLLLEHK